MIVNKKQFSFYLGVSYNTALKEYELYKEILEKDTRKKLTIYDLAKVDDLTLTQVLERLGLTM